MDEEKTIDEEKTVDEAVEEMTGEMKEFEPVAFDEAVKETEPERKDAPVLRDAPEPADMNMIHKHLDNFLAKIAGETPIDENVRDSTEYWLKRIAESGGGGGGSTKYAHNIYVGTNPNGAGVSGVIWVFTLLIINESETQFSTVEDLANYLYTSGYNMATKAFPVSGFQIRIGTGIDEFIKSLYSANNNSVTIKKNLISSGSENNVSLSGATIVDTVFEI